MPPEGLPLVVTSGLGIGVFAGVVSGIAYVFLQGFRSSGKRQYGVITSAQCCVCGVHFNQQAGGASGAGAVGGSGASVVGSLKEIRKRVRCCECHGQACRGGSCSLYLRREGQWLCTQCRKPTSWFRAFLAGWPPRGFTVRMSRQNSTQTNNSLETRSLCHEKGEEKEIVRDFIERLVGSMLEANLDDTSVNRLYRDPEYDAMFDRYHTDISSALTDLGSALHISIANLPITGQTPCTAHATLKGIIRRVLRDASNMAVLKEPQPEAQLPEDSPSQTYEDLLATAILNKVIDNYQHEVRRSSSTSSNGTYSRKSEKSSKKKSRQTSTPSSNKDENWKSQEMDTTSLSSVEDWCRSESSYGSKRVDPVSLTIQHSIEEITTSEDENISYQKPKNLSRNSFRDIDEEPPPNHEDWQDNWLFSRKGKGSPKPVPVPMLVPSPSTEFRALIGDRDAEDTTDLSETGSDIDDTETISSIKNILVDSRTVIGGKNLLQNLNSDLLEAETLGEFEQDGDVCRQKKERPVTEVHVHAEVIINGHDNEYEIFEKDEDFILGRQDPEREEEEISERKTEERKVSKDEEKVEAVKIDDITKKQEVQSDISEAEAKNDAVIFETPYIESDSLGSNTEKDAEYTEKYASFPRPIKKSPVPSPRSSHTSNEEQKLFLNARSDTMQEEIEISSDEETEPPISLKGSYSEREKEKWKNPIAMKNNPYSKENLDKRLQTKHYISTTYGRDYYIREAKRATGGREKKDEPLEETRRDFHRPKSLPSTMPNDLDKFSVNPGVFMAVPIIINGDEDEKTNGESVETEKKRPRPQSLALSSDSDDIDVKRVYNVETGNIQKIKTKDLTKEIKKDSKSPVGIRQFIVDEMITPQENPPVDEVIAKFDENHNNSYDNENIYEKSEPVMKISACKNLLSVGVINVPSYEEKSCTIELSDEFSLESQNSSSNGVEKLPEMRDISKKYLNSLVKGSQKPYVVNSYTTPPVSIYDVRTEDDTQSEGTIKDTNFIQRDQTDSFDELDNSEGTITPLSHKSKSCIDISNIEEPQNTFLSTEYPTLKEKKIVSQFIKDLTKSVPNLQDLDDKFSTETNKKYSTIAVRQKSIYDEEDLLAKPSVKDLRKLFDRDEPKVQETTQSKTSHLSLPRPNHKQVYSLTARSIPYQVRNELKDTTDGNIIERNGFEQRESGEVEIKLPKCRSKIEFFECLRNK